MNSIVLHQNCSVISEKNVSSVLLYGVKLNNVGHIKITSIMKRLIGWGTDFFQRPARKYPRFPEDIPEISWKYRNSPFSLQGRDFRPGLLQSCHTEPGKIVPDSAKVYSGLRSAKLR
jgi:hypothetical protein